MKDFCKKEQIFFNEGDRINFLSTRSKNHYKLYKHAFETSTTKYMTGEHNVRAGDGSTASRGLKLQSSEQDFQKAIEELQNESPSKVPL